MNNFNPNNYFANIEKNKKESKTLFRKYRHATDEECAEMQKKEAERKEQLKKFGSAPIFLDEDQITQILDTDIFIFEENKSFTLSELINSDDSKKRLAAHRLFIQLVKSAREINQL